MKHSDRDTEVMAHVHSHTHVHIKGGRRDRAGIGDTIARATEAGPPDPDELI